MGALDGIKVVDLSRLLPGPYCSMVLADHGAEVIAIEGRQYERDELYFSDLYRNKRHMTLNLKSDEGKQIFVKLATDADVILEGFRPGVAKRLGVDYQALKKDNPGVVYCSISGYGQTGGMSEAAGHDVNYLSRSGLLDLIGEKEGAPVIPAVQLADIAGAMNGVIGVLLALHEREASGVGQYLDISMTDSLLGFLTAPLHFQKKRKSRQQRSSTIFSHRYACYNTYETADGKYFALGAVEERFWHILCEKLGLQHYSSLQYDESKKEEIIQHLRELFLSKDLNHWEDLLSQQDVCFSVIKDMEGVLEDSLFRQRQMVIDQGEGDSLGKTFASPVKLQRTPASLRSVPQKFGESTREILCELGYDTKNIERLFATGIV